VPNKIPHFRLFLFAGPIVAIGLVLLAMTGPFGPEVARGLFWGVMCGQTTAAAAWCALGPARLAWRLPASLVWIAVLAAIDAFTRRNYLATASHSVSVVMEVLGQWLLIQIVLVSVSALGVQLRHRDDDREIDPRTRQFGIRQLLVATTIVGVTFGVGRFVVTSLGIHVDVRIPNLVFFVIADPVITLPLLLVSLLPQRALPLTVFVLLLIGLVTAWEAPVFLGITGYDAKELFIWSNTAACVWILAIVVAVRLSGYRLRTPGSAAIRRS
jgi:hypothetical protein